MTEKITLELTLEELKMIDKYIEYHDYDCDKPLLEKIRNAYPSHKSPVENAYRVWWGQYPELETDSKYDDTRWQGFQAGFQAAYEEKVREDDDVVDEPYRNVKAYWDEKDNPASYITDEVVNRLVEKHKSQKLYNMVRDELGYSFDCCDEFIDLVERWLPKEQSAAGSQNVDTELLVDGFNDCLRKIKEMLR